MIDNRDGNILSKILSEVSFLRNEVNATNYEKFMADERTKRVFAMTVLNIGELANSLSKKVKNLKEIKLDEVIMLRHLTAHGYHQLRFDVVWRTATIDIPAMEMQIKKLLNR